MENLRSRVKITLCNQYGSRFGARSLIAQPNFKKFIIFDEDFVAIEQKVTSLVMNKPIAIGMSILDLSKCTMYQFLYGFLKPKYKEKLQVAYTDTDSFILDVETDDFYKDISENIDLFDTSDYPYPNQYNIERKNKKIPKLFKDELILEFVGLRSKCYAIRSLSDGSSKDKIQKSKGIKKSVVKKKLRFQHYLDCINNSSLFHTEQNTIQAMRHKVYSIKQNKIALNPHDDKRCLIKPGVETLAWGHYKISKK